MPENSIKEYSSYQHLKIKRPANGILMVTLNRPETLNAMNYRMHIELAQIWDDIAADSATKVVVVTGEGRAFSSGNDLRQPDPTPEQVYEVMQRAVQITYGMANLEKPIISAINGVAVGAGLQVALMADISVAAEDANLIDGHTRVGVVPGDHAVLLWPMVIGLTKAKYYLMTNEPLSGREAERIGLVSLAVPGDQVLPRAMAIAESLVEGSQQALRWTKRSLNAWIRQAAPIFEQSIALELVGFFSPDVDEARRAFREKRKPAFPSSL